MLHTPITPPKMLKSPSNIVAISLGFRRPLSFLLKTWRSLRHPLKSWCPGQWTSLPLLVRPCRGANELIFWIHLLSECRQESLSCPVEGGDVYNLYKDFPVCFRNLFIFLWQFSDVSPQEESWLLLQISLFSAVLKLMGSKYRSLFSSLLFSVAF